MAADRPAPSPPRAAGALSPLWRLAALISSGVQVRGERYAVLRNAVLYTVTPRLFSFAPACLPFRIRGPRFPLPQRLSGGTRGQRRATPLPRERRGGGQALGAQTLPVPHPRRQTGTAIAVLDVQRCGEATVGGGRQPSSSTPAPTSRLGSTKISAVMGPVTRPLAQTGRWISAWSVILSHCLDRCSLDLVEGDLRTSSARPSESRAELAGRRDRTLFARTAQQRFVEHPCLLVGELDHLASAQLYPHHADR